MDNLRGTIAEAFKQPDPERGDWNRLFLEKLHASYEEADRIAHQHLVRVIVSWVIAYSIGVGLIEEGEIGAFKVSKIKSLLVLAPPIIGYYGYALSNTMVLAVTLRHALFQCYKHLFPKLYDLNLEKLVVTPSFLNIENFFPIDQDSPIAYIQSIGHWVIAYGLVFGSLLPLLHSVHLLWITRTWPWYATVISATIGITLWLKGLTFWTLALKYNGDGN